MGAGSGGDSEDLVEVEERRWGGFEMGWWVCRGLGVEGRRRRRVCHNHHG